jgi:Zn-dependent protease with chaperone function
MVVGDGKVFVFSELLNLCTTDDELATVLAHETGHQVSTLLF